MQFMRSETSAAEELTIRKGPRMHSETIMKTKLTCSGPLWPKAAHLKARCIAGLSAILLAMAMPRLLAADTLIGDTVQYEVRSASSAVFGSGSGVVGTNVEFVVDAAADIGFADGKIAVDISDSSILFKGPTTPNTFRYGYESIRVFSLDFQAGAGISA